MQVKVARPNPELGVLAHMAGVVKVGNDCREQDESDHAKFCSSNKAKTVEATRSRRLSKTKKQ